jgi:hypothetical protein
MQHRVIFPPEKRNPALADQADTNLQPKLGKWLVASIERPKAKEATALRG